MSKHTPGPWMTEGGRDSWFIRPASDAPAVAQVAMVQDGDIDFETTDANAALVCAAPAMADILSDFIAAWEDGIEFDTGTLRRFVRRMRATLPGYAAPNAPERT